MHGGPIIATIVQALVGLLLLFVSGAALYFTQSTLHRHRGALLAAVFTVVGLLALFLNFTAFLTVSLDYKQDGNRAFNYGYISAIAIGMVFNIWMLSRGIGAYQRKEAESLRGLCKRCRYDLTGNVSRICPECGEQIASGSEHVGR